MATSTDNSAPEYGTVGIGAVDMERYEEVALENGEVVIYDRENEDAWIQSESAIGLEFMI